MKLNLPFAIAALTFVTGTCARSRASTRFGDDDEPLSQVSQVTAFVNTDEGLKVQCWAIGDLLPDSNPDVRAMTLAGNLGITLFSFAPSVTLFSFGVDGMHTSAVDFRGKPNLFTVKDGLVFIEVANEESDGVQGQASGSGQHVFADVNGDDWFYFEDTSSSGSFKVEKLCTKERNSVAQRMSARTISGSDTTLINFQYDQTPTHRVLHEGRCNFAGLKPSSNSGQSNTDARAFKLRHQSL